jgi:hypothetical protein
MSNARTPRPFSKPTRAHQGAAPAAVLLCTRTHRTRRMRRSPGPCTRMGSPRSLRRTSYRSSKCRGSSRRRPSCTPPCSRPWCCRRSRRRATTPRRRTSRTRSRPSRGPCTRGKTWSRTCPGKCLSSSRRRPTRRPASCSGRRGRRRRRRRRRRAQHCRRRCWPPGPGRRTRHSGRSRHLRWICMMTSSSLHRPSRTPPYSPARTPLCSSINHSNQHQQR